MTTEDDNHAKQNGRRPSGNAAARPGAQKVAADEAARLDQRIAEKQAAAWVAVAIQQTPAAAKIELSQFEQDIAAKNADRAMNVTGDEAKPGAVAERRSSARTQLSDLENDVASKSRARRPGSSTEMQDGAFAKSRTRGSSPPTTQPGARTELSQLESAVVTKSRQSGVAPIAGGSSRAELAQLESLVAAKTVAATAAPSLEVSSTTSPPPVEVVISTSSDFEEKEIYFKDYYDDDQKQGFDVESEQPEDKYGEADESADAPPVQINTVNAATATADHGMIRAPSVEYGEVQHQQDAVEGLAVAVAVTDVEDCAFIPAAVQYDPDAKPPIYRNRRFRLYTLGALFLVVVVAIGVAFTITQIQSKSAFAPTFAPTSSRENLGIRQQLQLVVGEQKLADPSTPHYKALDWIINKDPMQLTRDSENLVQRFLTALLYYSTIEYGPWLSCNPQEKGQDETCFFAKLVTVYPNQYQQVPWIRWLSSFHECRWAGVFCDEFDQVRSFELYGNELSGQLPVDVANFPFLQSMSLEWNNFYGTLPPEWGQIRHLLNIEVHYNFLTGTVPDSWWRAETLQRLNIGGNQLTGSIPSDISGLSILRGFFTFDNNFNGTLPTELGELEFLGFTRHAKNFFTGTIPSEVGNLVNVQEFWLHRTEIGGSLPTEIGNMGQLRDFRFYYSGLQGSFPSEFYNLVHLSRLDAFNCNLTGTISSDITNFQQLAIFHVRNNNLSGTIPTQMGNLTMLKDVWLQGNRFNGSVPTSLCDLHVKVLETDCSSTNQTGPPAIFCPLRCCSTCCSQDGGICISQVSS